VVQDWISEPYRAKNVSPNRLNRDELYRTPSLAVPVAVSQFAEEKKRNLYKISATSLYLIMATSSIGVQASQHPCCEGV